MISMFWPANAFAASTVPSGATLTVSTLANAVSLGVLTLGGTLLCTLSGTSTLTASSVTLSGQLKGGINTRIINLQCSSFTQTVGTFGFDSTHGEILTCSGACAIGSGTFVLKDSTSTAGSLIVLFSVFIGQTAGTTFTVTGTGTLVFNPSTYTNIAAIVVNGVSANQTLSGNYAVGLTLTTGVITCEGAARTIAGAFSMSAGTLNMASTDSLTASGAVTFTGGTLNLTGTGWSAGTNTLVYGSSCTGTPTLGTVPTGFAAYPLSHLDVVGNNLVLTLTAVSSGPACYSITEIGGSKANNGIIEVG